MKRTTDPTDSQVKISVGTVDEFWVIGCRRVGAFDLVDTFFNKGSEIFVK